LPVCRGQQIGRARLDLRRRVECARKALENRLGDVMRLLAVDELHVQVRTERIAERAAKFLHQYDVEIAHEHRRRLRRVHEMRTPADVDDDSRERFVHRQQEEAVAFDADFVAERFLEGLPEHESDILDRVVIIDVGVAGRLDREIEQTVLGEQREHVVEERHARVDLRLAATVDRERQRDIGLRGFPRDGRYTLGGAFSHASRVFCRTSISSSVPTLTRRKEAVKAWLPK
jgi:hypothetical protein